MVEAKVTTAVTDVDDYKNCVTSRLERVGNASETKFNDTDAKINNLESNSASIENMFVVAGRQLDSVDMALGAWWRACGLCKPH